MSDNLPINGRKLHLFHMELNVTCMSMANVFLIRNCEV